MPLVVLAAGTPGELESGLRAFEAAGFEVRRETGVDAVDRDLVLGLPGPTAAALRQLDDRGLRYVLVHVGQDGGEPEGSHERAHHRVSATELPELARRLRSRERMQLTCLAFAYKSGIPAESSWVVDTRFLDNPYWVPELKPLDGRDAAVRDYVLRQPAAACLLDGLEATLTPLLPEYRSRGRSELTVAFGCTGGRHRSVALAQELARRLPALSEVEVKFRARDLQT